MPEQTIPPYAHPTTVVMVDDNDMFLQTLDLRMPADMAYLLFHNPREESAPDSRTDFRSLHLCRVDQADE